MSTNPDPRSEAASRPGPVPEADASELASALDAAEAAGYGGIAWADELEDAPVAADQGADPGGQAKDPTGPGARQAPGGSTAASNGNGDEVTVESAPGEGGAVADDDAEAISVEDLVHDLERVTNERDQYLDASRRLQAEFENYRKAVVKREQEARERANESLVNEILPVLDACDGALASGATDVEPVRTSLLEVLTKQGLDRIDDQDAPFDPERHEAVMHDPDPDGDVPIVAEVMRAGYSWKGRVVRPAMVRVRG